MAKKNERTARELARLIEGEVENPLEEARLLRAIAEDPVLAEQFQILSSDLEVELEDAPSDDELTRMVRSSVTGMARARLWGVTLHGYRPTLANQAKIVGEIAGLDQGIPKAYPLELRRQEGSTDDWSVKIDGLSDNYRPVNLVLAKVDLRTERFETCHETLGIVNWPNRVRLAARTVEHPLDPTLVAHLGADAGNNNRRKALLERAEETSIHLSCDAVADRDTELGLVEVHIGNHSYRQGVALERSIDPSINSFCKDYVELKTPPEDLRMEPVRLIFRPAGTGDLRDIDNRAKTAVLAECEHHCFPLMASENGYWTRFTKDDLARLADSNYVVALSVVDVSDLEGGYDAASV